MNKEEMRKAFEEWVNATTNYLSSCWVVFGGDNGRYRAMRGSESDADRVSFAFYAWQARQPEIDQLKSEIEKLKLDIVFIKEWSGYKDKPRKIKFEYKRLNGFDGQGEK